MHLSIGLHTEILAAHTVIRTQSLATAFHHARRTFPEVLRFEPWPSGDGFELHSRSVTLDGVKLRAVTSTGHEIALVDHGAFGVIVPLTGRIAVDDGRHRAEGAPGALLLPGLGRRTTICAGPYSGLVLAVPRALLQTQLDVEPASQKAGPIEGLGIVDGSSDGAASLLDYLAFLVREIDRGGLVLRCERTRASAAAMLLDLLVALVLERETISARRPMAAAAAPWQVGRAEAYIREHASEPLTVARIAAAVGTSTRALQFAFQRHRQTTPRAYLEACRLERLRRELARAGPEATVTDLAAECGISHQGRCASAYRRRFGELPSETLALARRRN